jgi:hypothetical protein
VGNVVGVYHGSDPASRRLLTGSHYETVRDGGKYDGRLGIFVPMAAVHELHQACPPHCRPSRRSSAIPTATWASSKSTRNKALCSTNWI